MGDTSEPFLWELPESFWELFELFGELFGLFGALFELFRMSWVALGRAEQGCAQLEAASAAMLIGKEDQMSPPFL